MTKVLLWVGSVKSSETDNSDVRIAPERLRNAVPGNTTIIFHMGTIVYHKCLPKSITLCLIEWTLLL